MTAYRDRLNNGDYDAPKTKATVNLDGREIAKSVAKLQKQRTTKRTRSSR